MNAPLPSKPTVNVASHLPTLAQTRPHTLAIVEPVGKDRQGRLRYRHLTYRELDAETDLLARGLAQVGIGRGTRTVLMVTPSLEFYALTFALFKLGAVIVLIDPGMGVKNLGICLGEAEPEAFIGIPKAHLGRLLYRWARPTLRHLVTVGRRLGWGGWTLEQVRIAGASVAETSTSGVAITHTDETAAILFTSGSTGVAKGAIYTHGIFAAQVQMLREIYGIEPGEVDLPTFPLFGLFGPALGMTAIIPQMDFTRPALVDPTKILDTIEYFGVTNLFGSPALIRRVGRYGEAQGVKLPTLRRVISAGAPVPASEIDRFARMLTPGVQVHTPYGATEALPVCSIGSDEILGETASKTPEGAGVCVGRPVAGMRVRIIRISDEPIPTWSEDLEVPTGEVGEIVVQGPVATRAYYNRPESTALAKIADETRADSAVGPPPGVTTLREPEPECSQGEAERELDGFYHRMGDLGYLDAQGRLWFCGRKSQRVVTPRETLFTVPCEGVFNGHPAVARSALVGVRRGAEVEPVVCIEREKNGVSLSTDQLRAELLELGATHEHTRNIQQILFHDAFPVDIRHNAKIFREQLAEWAARQLS